MELRLGSRVFGPGDFAIWLAGGLSGEIAHVPEGVDIVTASASGPKAAGPAVATAAPVPDRAAGGAVLLVGDELAAAAASTGAGLVCRDPRRALAAGVRADGLVVDAGARPPAQRVEELTKDGLAVMVSLDDEPVGEDAGLLAAISVHAWLGVRVFRVAAPDVAPVRQVLDMVASIRGARPPSLARRGLA